MHHTPYTVPIASMVTAGMREEWQSTEHIGSKYDVYVESETVTCEGSDGSEGGTCVGGKGKGKGKGKSRKEERRKNEEEKMQTKKKKKTKKKVLM
jgi:hypothetical protein